MCRRFVASFGMSVVIIDFFQLQSSRRKFSDRLKELEYISGYCKALARRLDIAVILVAQLNRQTENRPDHRPDLSSRAG